MTTKVSSKQALEAYGLDGKESQVYLGLLTLGDTNMTDLLKKVPISRSTAYKIITRLKTKDLVTSYRTSSGMRFVATKPEVLVSRVQQNLDKIKNALPALMAMDETNPEKKETKIRVFYGATGYQAAIEDSLQKPHETLRHIGSLDEVHKIKTKHYDLHYYMPKRIKNNIFLRSLYFSDTAPEVSEVEQHKFLRDVRYIPDKYHYKGATLIYGDTVIITSSKKTLVSIMIKNKMIAEGERKKFDLIWDLIGPTKIKISH